MLVAPAGAAKCLQNQEDLQNTVDIARTIVSGKPVGTHPERQSSGMVNGARGSRSLSAVHGTLQKAGLPRTAKTNGKPRHFPSPPGLTPGKIRGPILITDARQAGMSYGDRHAMHRSTIAMIPADARFRFPFLLTGFSRRLRPDDPRGSPAGRKTEGTDHHGKYAPHHPHEVHLPR